MLFSNVANGSPVRRFRASLEQAGAARAWRKVRIRDGVVTKRYQALILDAPKDDRFEVNQPLLKTETASGERSIEQSIHASCDRNLAFYGVLENHGKNRTRLILSDRQKLLNRAMRA